MKRDMRNLWIMFALSFLIVLGMWGYASRINMRWANVPPAPTDFSARAFGIGDAQTSYRAMSMMLQIFGNTGGRYTALDQYNYEELRKWFDMLYSLDPVSEYLPFLVAYYFAAAHNPDQLRIVAHFLDMVGSVPENYKWPWLAQAVYIARYRLNDMDYAIALTKKLADHPDPSVGIWARNMESIVRGGMGDKQAALAISLGLLKEKGAVMDHKELYYLTDYICSTLLAPEEKKNFEFCDMKPGE